VSGAGPRMPNAEQSVASRRSQVSSRKQFLTGATARRGGPATRLPNADIFIGLSVGGALKPEWIKFMDKNSIVFALANPDPEIDPRVAK
jgi:malic enzyme